MERVDVREGAVIKCASEGELSVERILTTEGGALCYWLGNSVGRWIKIYADNELVPADWELVKKAADHSLS